MRQIPSIGVMTPDQIMRKQKFVIPVPPGFVGTTNFTSDKKAVSLTLDSLQYENKTQADFLREYHVNSHKINSIKYYPNTLFVGKDDGKYQAKVRSRIAIGFQERIKTKRKTALLGNNVGMKLVSSQSSQQLIDRLSFFREGWEDKNIEVAIDRAIESDYKTADCAVCFYLDRGHIGWRTFSFDSGDILYPHYHPLTGELAVFGRKYSQEDFDGNIRTYLDVWDNEYFVTYVQESDKPDWRVEGSVEKHGFPTIPVAYHRSNNGPVWSASQSLIDGYEVAISQFAENNAAYALRILYTLGGDFELMSNTDGTPSRIDSVDPNAKVGFLEPAQGADGAFATQLAIMEKNIMRGSFAVETPEIKSGADMSSRTVKMLFADSYLKAIEDSMEYQIFLDRILYLFKFGYFMENNLVNEVDGFKVKPYLDPFVFMSEADVIAAIQQLVAAGCLSKKTATEIAYNTGYGSPDEWDRLLQEAHDELVAQQAQNTTTTATTTRRNPVAESRLNND